MKQIEFTSSNLKQVMYGLLLPAVAGTIFWYLIQHADSSRYLELFICVVLVYYFSLHFLSGSQVSDKRYGILGFVFDFMIVFFTETLFYSVDGLPARLDLGQISIVMILISLLLWNIKTIGYKNIFTCNITKVIIIGIFIVIGFWITSHKMELLSEHYAMLLSSSTLAIASTYYLLLSDKLKRRKR